MKQKKVLSFSKRNLEKKIFSLQENFLYVDRDLIELDVAPKILELEEKADTKKKETEKIKKSINLIEKELEKFSPSEDLQREIDNKEEQISKINFKNLEISKLKKSLKLLEDIPNVDACKTCVLVGDLYKKEKWLLPKLEKNLQELQSLDNENITELKEKLRKVLSLTKNMNVKRGFVMKFLSLKKQ